MEDDQPDDEPDDESGEESEDEPDDELDGLVTTALAATTVIENPAAKPDSTRVLPAQATHDGATHDGATHDGATHDGATHDGATRVMPTAAGATPPTTAGTDFDPDAYDDPDNPDAVDVDLDAAHTQRLAPDGFRRGAPDDLEEEWDDEAGTWVDEDGVEWIEGDLDASEVVPEGSGYVRPPVPRRWGSLLALAALVAAAAALAPVIVLVALVALLLLVRTYGTAVESMHARREVRGVRASDLARTLAASPWYLVRAVVGLVPSLVVASCVILLAGGAVAWLVDNGTWVIGDLSTGDDVDGTAAALVVAALVVLWLVVAWWGPASAMSRIGARRGLEVVAPGRLGALVLVAVCLVAAFVLAMLVSNGASIVWAPAPVPTIP